MADMIWIAQTAEVALSAGVEKTVLQIVAPANQRLKVLRWGVYFDGTVVTAEPAQIRLLRQTTGGTMSSLTPVKLGTQSESIQASAYHTATAEPTAGDVLDMCEAHTQGGYEVIFPIGQDIKVPGGGRIGIAITSPADVNVRAKIIVEE